MRIWSFVKRNTFGVNYSLAVLALFALVLAVAYLMDRSQAETEQAEIDRGLARVYAGSHASDPKLTACVNEHLAPADLASMVHAGVTEIRVIRDNIEYRRCSAAGIKHEPWNCGWKYDERIEGIGPAASTVTPFGERDIDAPSVPFGLKLTVNEDAVAVLLPVDAHRPGLSPASFCPAVLTQAVQPIVAESEWRLARAGAK